MPRLPPDVFRVQWRDGMRAERAVEAKLRARLVDVTRPAKTCRPSLGERARHRDRGDLQLTGTRWWLEVKSRRQTFQADPRRFPFDLVLVDTVKAIRGTDRAVAAYIIHSQDTGACVVVPASSAPRWTVQSIDTLDGEKRALFVPRGLLRSLDDLASWCRGCQGRGDS